MDYINGGLISREQISMFIITKKVKKIFKICSLVFIFLFLSVIILSGVEKNIMPKITEISGLKVKSFADNAIDAAVKESIEEMNLNSSDFLIRQQETTYIAADTVLVNKLCADINSRLDYTLTHRGKEEIAIPLGAVLGTDILSNIGPRFKFSVIHKDDTKVDYETSFSQAGINQTNYKVWLTVEITLRMVNPLKSTDVTTTRKIMLIDTIIKGNIPQTYFEINSPGGIISR